MEVYCEAHPLDITTDSVSESPLSPSENQYFNIKVYYDEKFYMLNETSSLLPICDTTEYIISNIPKEAIEQETYTLLSYLSVAEEDRDFIAEKILTYANNMVNVTHKNHKFLYMNVFMSVTRFNEDDDEFVEEPMEHQVHGLVPASKSAIDGLERVKVMEKCNCAICLEDFEVDSKGVRMPCLHLFHEICMINWLQEGHYCPLCRFEMPTSESE